MADRHVKISPRARHRRRTLLLVPAKRALGQSLATIRVVGAPTDSYKTTYYAQRSGLFQKYGLKVDATWGTSEGRARALAAGAVEVVAHSILPVAQAHARSVPFQIIVPAGWYFSDKPQTAPSRSGIRRFRARPRPQWAKPWGRPR